MNGLGCDRLLAALSASWPPARSWRFGAWTLRDGAGGGKRVSAATAETEVGASDVALLSANAAAAGRPALVMVRPGECALDALLDAEAWRALDPTVFYAAEVETLAGPLPSAAIFTAGEPLAVMRGIWAAGGIGPNRLAVMDRVGTPKACLLAQLGDRAAGAGFVAVAGAIAMVHALEVPERHRRSGAGTLLMRAAANWGRASGATHIALAVTEANAPARALYARLGMIEVGGYQYRVQDPA